ncbi:MAG: GAF domain-containing protein [Anaerolineales bacterium]|nr:GAF domain-containing protein [Anaerolineales bacterium]
MSNRHLKSLAVVLPTLFLAVVLYLRFNLTPAGRELEANLYAILAVALGAIVFSIFVFNAIERSQQALHETNRHLEALHQAALALTTELDLQAVLQKVVHLSRELLNAKYGALGVADEEGNRIRQFITSGISDEARARIGPPPQGHGLLGVLNPGGQPLIVNDISKDPRSAGFPPNHPPMQSLLGVPIRSKGELFGNLYVADKFELSAEGEQLLNFDPSDQQLLEKFATQAAIAIENAQLYRKTQELAVLQERERFGMALHDGIMQQVYATGLSLQEAQRRLGERQPQEAGSRIGQSIEDLSQILRDLRNYILGLRTGRYQGQDLASSLAQMARELHANTLMNVRFTPPEKPAELGLSEVQTDELIYIVQEALSNIRKHAYARNVDLGLERSEAGVRLRIDDDGVGFDLDGAGVGGGNGLRNMRERAHKLDGALRVWSQLGKGTHIELVVPVAAPEAASLPGA